MPRKSRKNVGLIGLGIIGAQVATGLRAAGFQVFVWNRSAKPAPNFLGSPAEVADACEIIQIFVSDAPALFKVIEAMGNSLTPKHVIICNATVGPKAVIEAAKMVMERGAKLLDAPFTGSKTAAEKRELVYYIGGDEATFQRAKPVLEATGKALVRIGDIGHASTVKVVTNMISAVTVQTLAEALAIVQKAGLAPEVLGLAIANNGCRSGVIELKLPKMVSGNYDPHFSLKNMFKDVQLGIHLANALNIDIPATTVTAGILYGAINRGWADLDFSALYKVYESHERPAAPPSQEKRQPAPIRPLGEPKPIGGDLSPENSSPAPSPLPSLQLPEPGAESRLSDDDPLPETPAIPANTEAIESVETESVEPVEIDENGEAAMIMEAVIAEFRDVPPENDKTASTSQLPEEEPAEEEETNPPDNGDEPQSLPQSLPQVAPRRVSFVKRWFVSRQRGS